MMAPYPNLFGLPLAISVPNFMLVPQNARLFWLSAALLFLIQSVVVIVAEHLCFISSRLEFNFGFI